MTIEFVEFPKMARLSREVVITEKLDGTNAAVLIAEYDARYGDAIADAMAAQSMVAQVGNLRLFAQSRSRFITPTDDNFGFAAWVRDNAAELVKLGPGRHFGEWWGSGIQRKYGLTEKRFSLFNVLRWAAHGTEPQTFPTGDPRVTRTQDVAPACCHIVPILFRGPFDTDHAEIALEMLRTKGSRAAPGFTNPEGIVVFHIAGNVGFKKTLGDDGNKGARK